MIKFRIEDQPDQQFSAILERRRVTLRLRYNVTSARWSFDIAIDDVPVLHGRRIVTGVDLLKPFNLGIGVIFAASANLDRETAPDLTSLVDGSVNLYQTTVAEIESVQDPAPSTAIITPNERPIWTAPPPIYFGSVFDIARELDNIEDGFAINFVTGEMLIRSNIDAGLNYFGTVGTALTDGKLTFARASIASRFNASGIFEVLGADAWRLDYDPMTLVALGFREEPIGENLITQSANGLGTSYNVTGSTDVATAPDGSSTADLIIEDATNDFHIFGQKSQTMVAGEKYVWSLFAKKAPNPRRVVMVLNDSVAYGQATFDLVTGDWDLAIDSGFVDKGFEVLPNDWFRLWIVFEATISAGGSAYAYFLNEADAASYIGDTFSGAYIWGRDLKIGDTISSHIPTAGTEVTREADDMRFPLANFPYLDGDGVLFVSGVATAPVIDGTDLVITAPAPVESLTWKATA